jgi:hypothetical protein
MARAFEVEHSDEIEAHGHELAMRQIRVLLKRELGRMQRRLFDSQPALPTLGIPMACAIPHRNGKEAVEYVYRLRLKRWELVTAIEVRRQSSNADLVAIRRMEATLDMLDPYFERGDDLDVGAAYELLIEENGDADDLA